MSIRLHILTQTHYSHAFAESLYRHITLTPEKYIEGIAFFDVENPDEEGYEYARFIDRLFGLGFRYRFIEYKASSLDFAIPTHADLPVIWEPEKWKTEFVFDLNGHDAGHRADMGLDISDTINWVMTRAMQKLPTGGDTVWYNGASPGAGWIDGNAYHNDLVEAYDKRPSIREGMNAQAANSWKEMTK